MHLALSERSAMLKILRTPFATILSYCSELCAKRVVTPSKRGLSTNWFSKFLHMVLSAIWWVRQIICCGKNLSTTQFQLKGEQYITKLDNIPFLNICWEPFGTIDPQSTSSILTVSIEYLRYPALISERKNNPGIVSDLLKRPTNPLIVPWSLFTRPQG